MNNKLQETHDMIDHFTPTEFKQDNLTFVPVQDEVKYSDRIKSKCIRYNVHNGQYIGNLDVMLRDDNDLGTCRFKQFMRDPEGKQRIRENLFSARTMQKDQIDSGMLEHAGIVVKGLYDKNVKVTDIDEWQVTESPLIEKSPLLS